MKANTHSPLPRFSLTTLAAFAVVALALTACEKAGAPEPTGGPASASTTDETTTDPKSPTSPTTADGDGGTTGAAKESRDAGPFHPGKSDKPM